MPLALRAALLVLLASSPAVGDEARVRLTILHTNDLHGQVYPLKALWSRQENPPLAGGFAALASMIEAERARAAKAGEGVLLLDAGDCWQGTPEGNLTDGRIAVEWMNLVGYDAMAIGNHEFDAGPLNVPRLAAAARFPWLAANLVDERTGERPDFARGAVEKEVAGVRVAVVGLIAEDTKRISSPRATAGFEFRPALETARGEVAAARARGADVVIVLSHCGAGTDKALAASVPGIDAVIGGHTHQALDPPHVDPATGTIVAATYSKGTTLGRVRLTYDRGARRVVERSGEVIDCHTADWPAHAPTEKLIAAYAVTINAIMDEPLGTATEDLIRQKGFPSSELGSWLADVMREAAKADVALTNKAGIRAEIPKGPIRLREVYQVSPFGNTIVTMKLTGRELREAIELSLTDPALGFEVSGIEVRYDLERPPGDRAVAIKVGDAPLDLERTYVVATNSFLAKGGDGHRVLAGGRDRRETGIDIMRAHADDVKRRGEVRLAIPARVSPAEPTMPAEKP